MELINQRGNKVRGPEIKCTYAGNNHYYQKLQNTRLPQYTRQHIL